MWDWAIWGALILAGITGTATLVLLAIRTLDGWRRFKRVRSDVVGRLDELASNGVAVAEKVAVTGDTTELQESLGRLRFSLAQLAALRAAIGEVQDTFGRVTAFVPRK